MVKKKLFHILILSHIILFVSCELFVADTPEGTMHILVYAWGNGLTGTVQDAFQMGRVLEALCIKEGRDYDVTYILGDITGVDDVAQIISDSDEVIEYSTDSTKGNFIKALEEINSNSNDTTVIYLATHGDFSSSIEEVEYSDDLLSNSALLFPVEGGYTSLKDSDFLEYVNAINGKKLIITDVCHTGGLIENGNVSVNTSAFFDQSSYDLLFDDSVPYYSPDLYVISATSYSQTAEGYEIQTEEDYESHGYFTYYLLEGLGWNEEEQELNNVIPVQSRKIITVSDMAAYCEKNVPLSTQTACSSGGSEDLVLFSF